MSNKIEELRAFTRAGSDTLWTNDGDHFSAREIVAEYDELNRALERSRANAEDWRKIAEANTATGDKYRTVIHKLNGLLDELKKDSK